MKTFKAIASTVVAMAVLSIALVAPASADSLPSASKKTTVTTTHPLEIPGRVLPAGKYFFRVMDVVGTRNLVQITNENEKPIAILIAVPNYRLMATQSRYLNSMRGPQERRVPFARGSLRARSPDSSSFTPSRRPFSWPRSQTKSSRRRLSSRLKTMSRP